MQSEGRKDMFNPASALESLKSKREKLQRELLSIEKQVYELETSYLQESSHFGNTFKGFNINSTKKPRKLQPEERIFSLSSVTSPVAEEQGVGQDDGRMELGQARAKGGSIATNGQGRQKKGRIGQREGKKIKQSSDLDADNDDDDPT